MSDYLRLVRVAFVLFPACVAMAISAEGLVWLANQGGWWSFFWAFPALIWALLFTGLFALIIHRIAT